MKKLTLVILSMILVLTMSLPALAKGAQKSSVELARCSGMKDSTEFYISLITDEENPDQYILYLDKYNYETYEPISGNVKIPKSEVVFKTNKGTVKVNATVPLYKIEWVYDEPSDSYYPIETYVGEESVHLIWSFDPKKYSSHKYVDKNIQIGPDEYLKLLKSTYKEYTGVTVSGNIGKMEMVDLDYSYASVLIGTFLQVVKNK